MKKFVIVAVLVFALLVTLVACNNNKNPEETTAATTTNNEENTTVAETTKGEETAAEETTDAEGTTNAEETTAADETTEEVTTEEVTTAEETTAEETTEEETTEEGPKDYELKDITTVGGMSSDEYFENDGSIVNNGEAEKFIANERGGILKDVTSVAFRGWAGLGSIKTLSFGYSIDGNEPIWVDSFTVEFENDQDKAAIQAGQPNGLRYKIVINLADIEKGEHVLHLCMKGEDGNAYEMSKWGSIKIVGTKTFGPADVLDIDLTDGTWKDVPAKQNELATEGTVKVVERNGVNALEFDRVDENTGSGYLKVLNADTLYDTIKNGFTFELDVELPVTDPCSIVSNMQYGGFGFEILDNDYRLYFNMHCDGSYVGPSFMPDANVRYHLVATYDGNELTLYVNGEKVDSVVVGNNIQFAEEGSNVLVIGGDSDGQNGSLPCSAYIYGVRIYSKVATAKDVAQLYADS